MKLTQRRLEIRPHEDKHATTRGIFLRVSMEQYAKLLALGRKNDLGVGGVVLQMVEHCLEEEIE